MASPSVGELSPEFCCTDSKTFQLLKQIPAKLQAVLCERSARAESAALSRIIDES
jgi:hypothetical protein